MNTVREALVRAMSLSAETYTCKVSLISNEAAT